MRGLFVILIVFMSLFLAGCTEKVTQEEMPVVEELEEIEDILVEEIEEPSCSEPNVFIGGDCCLDIDDNEVCDEHEVKLGCENNADCEQGLLCIDRMCGTIKELYNTECEDKCKVTEVKVTTSDDEVYTLKLGQGSYSYAGSVEWKLVSTPAYCEGDDVLIPIKILKKNMGKVLSEEVVTLQKGETTGTITHPTVTQVRFTATLTEVTEGCS